MSLSVRASWDAGVGKTALLQRFATGRYLEGAATVALDMTPSYLQLGEQRVKLELCDTAGQEASLPRFES